MVFTYSIVVVLAFIFGREEMVMAVPEGLWFVQGTCPLVSSCLHELFGWTPITRVLEDGARIVRHVTSASLVIPKDHQEIFLYPVSRQVSSLFVCMLTVP